MKKLKEKLSKIIKNYSHETGIVLLLSFVSILLILNLYLSVNHLNNYEESKLNGNDKWRHVENILDSYEDRIEFLEKKK